MFAITINEKGGETRRLEFDKPEVTIGRVQGNDIILPKGNVSKRHSRIVFKDGKFIIVDLKSTNGTYVNGRKITSPLVIKGSDKVYIGDFILSVEDAEAAAADVGGDLGAPPLPPQQQRRPTMPPPPPRKVGQATSQVPVPDDDGAGVDGGREPIPTPARGNYPVNPFDDEGDQAMAPPPDDHLAPPLAPPDEPEPPAPEPYAPPPRHEPPPPAVARPPVARPTAPTAPSPRQPSGTPMAPRVAPEARPTMMGDGVSARPEPGAALDPPVRHPEPPPPARPPTTMAQPRPLASNGAAASLGGEERRAPGPTRPGPAIAASPIAAPAAGATPLRERKPPGPIAPPPAARPLAPAAAPAPAPAPPASAAAAPSPGLEAVLRAVGDQVASQRGEHGDPERLARAALDQLAAQGRLPPGVDRDAVQAIVAAESVGGGPAAALLDEPDVREVVVARHDRIFVERTGQAPQLSDRVYSSPEAVARAVTRLAAGRAPRDGLLEARLDDGTLLTAALPPLVTRGATLTLRRARPEPPSLASLVAEGVLSQGMADVLAMAVEARRNVLVSGGPGSGRSLVLAALANAAPDGERVVSVAHGEELALRHDHWIRLSAQGGMREAVLGALRLRPDRLVLDDLAPADGLAVLQLALAAPGVVAATHGASATEAIERIEGLALLGPGSGDARALRDLVARSVHAIVQLAPRTPAGPRVVQVAEVTGADPDGRARLTDVFHLRGEGHDARFAATGHVPSFAAGAPASLFRV